MHNLSAIARFFAVILASFCMVTVVDTSTTYAALQSKKKRVVVRYVNSDEPFELLGLEFNDQPVRFGEEFEGDDEWWTRPSIRIKNTSAKQITYLEIVLTLWDAPSVAKSSFVGKSMRNEKQGTLILIRPGEEYSMQVSDRDLDTFRQALRDYPRNEFRKLEVRVTEVQFSDTTYWILGQYFELTPDGDWRPIRKPAEKQVEVGSTLTSKANVPNVGPTRERVVTRPQIFVEPFVIPGFWIKGKTTVQPKQRFEGDANWLNNFSFPIRNVSIKPITYMVVSFWFPESRQTGAVIVVDFSIGQSTLMKGGIPILLAPGETTTFELTDRYREIVAGRLKRRGYDVNDITQVDVALQEVHFADNARWFAGDWFDLDEQTNTWKQRPLK